MFSERENSRKRLMELLGKPGNSHCADCGATAPEWASYTLGVFVCHSCSGLHRNIAHISKVKSLLLDPWTTAQLELMDSVGNHAAKATYEQTVPAFYFRPTHKDCALLREQWIRAKYERKEFMPGGRQESYSVGEGSALSSISDLQHTRKEEDDPVAFVSVVSGPVLCNDKPHLPAVQFLVCTHLEHWKQIRWVQSISVRAHETGQSPVFATKEKQGVFGIFSPLKSKAEYAHAPCEDAACAHKNTIVTCSTVVTWRLTNCIYVSGCLLLLLRRPEYNPTLWCRCVLGYREGFLWKRGKDNGQYLSRKFVLCEQEGVLKYFNKHDGREPKAIMSIATLNATFQPVKIGTAHGLQISYLKDENPRNLFVYHEDGKEMVDWFNTIRAARLSYLRVAFPGAPVADLLPKLTRDYVKQGFMEKTGPKHTEGFKKRWFCMDERRLMYFKDPLDAYARGQVFIGSQENGYDVLPGLPPGVHTSRWQYGITVATPDRTYLFACESEKERTGWIAAFHTFIGCPMLPQEYAVEARFKHQLDY
ncbi:arf-GAP with dual PH domain-containing protein 1-like isoform X2 [Syngnathus acus]|uniref:arf-GAP with dual PH domain-containing protein 1-like isoform X2 n=1 Tax=Syngnathus acus TaxID=161584 RepID=UPI001885B1C1|nr:arf-GAP with dual PH domain-containing protein 1-like isoform X2 [Syngnathus acus]